MHSYKAYNAPAPASAAIAKVTTGTSIKTMLQLAPPSNRWMTVKSWGYTLDAVPGSTGGIIELLQTDTAATVTAHVAAGLYSLYPGQPNSLLTLGTSASGYTASSENAPSVVKVLDADMIAPTAGAQDVNYDYQFFPDERPTLAVSTFLRVRVTFSAAVNMLCWVCWDE